MTYEMCSDGLEDKFFDCAEEPHQLNISEDSNLTSHANVSENNECAEPIETEAHTVTDPYFVDETYLASIEADLNSSQIEERKVQSLAKKAEGNQRYQCGEYLVASELYTDALRLCPLIYTEERGIMYSNRGACFVALNKDECAVGDCTKALELKPAYIKPLLRRAQIYEKAEDTWHKALEDYEALLKQDPGNPLARAACCKLAPLVQERNERMKAEMMGKLKDLGNLFLRPFGLSTDSFKLEEQPGGGYSVKMQK